MVAQVRWAGALMGGRSVGVRSLSGRRNKPRFSAPPIPKGRMSTAEWAAPGGGDAEAWVPNAVIAIHKPAGWTSQDVVAKIKGLVEFELRRREGGFNDEQGKKRRLKVGHGGTLDPLATGVLVVGLGRGTKVLEGYTKGAKGYRAVATLGEATDTLDREGAVTETKGWDHVTTEQLASALEPFRGESMQTTPMYSARRHQGKKLYELARVGITVERDQRPITIYSLDLVPETGPLPIFGLEMTCGGGTYVRSVIADLAEACGTVGHMLELERTQQGPFTLEHALKRNDWTFEKIKDHIDVCQRVLDDATPSEPALAPLYPPMLHRDTSLDDDDGDALTSAAAAAAAASETPPSNAAQTRADLGVA